MSYGWCDKCGMAKVLCRCSIEEEAMQKLMRETREQWQPGHMNTMTAAQKQKLVADQQKLEAHQAAMAQDFPGSWLFDGLTADAAGQKLKEGEGIAYPWPELDIVLMSGPLFATIRTLADDAARANDASDARAPGVLFSPGGGPTRATTLPTDGKERKTYPIATGVLDYFPDAIAAVARVSWQGNEQHNPGEPLHWARGKSMDQDDTLMRHFLQRGTVDEDGQLHSAKVAWRALAMLQLEIEERQKAKAA